VVRALVTALLLLPAGAVGAVAVSASGVTLAEEQKERPVRFPGANSAVYPGLRTVADLSQPGAGTRATSAGAYPELNATRALAFPGPEALEAARRYIATRHARISFAVADTRGDITGVGVNRRYRAASLVKAMVMVAYLNRLDRPPTTEQRDELQKMVRESDNDAATDLHREVGPEPMMELARRTGMRDFADKGSWSESTVTPADQARFFSSFDELVGPRYLDYARRLLLTIVEGQRWGVPDAAKDWRVLFKGGWRPADNGDLVHQGARLERGARTIAVAVLSDGNPNQRYGEKTIRGVAQRLLAPPPSSPMPPRPADSPAELIPVRRLDGRTPPSPPPLESLAG
jgi:beta-lactamase class A